MSLIPTSPQAPGEWPSPEELGARAAFTTPDHAPLSPQSSVASSGSEQTEEQGSSRNTFQEDGSGMKGTMGESSTKTLLKRLPQNLQGQKRACSCLPTCPVPPHPILPLPTSTPEKGTGLRSVYRPCP